MKKIICSLCLFAVVAFANNVENESYSHQKRIEILKKADVCIKSAKTKEEYRACEKAEQSERLGLRKEMKQKRMSDMNARIEKMPEGERKTNMRNMSQCLSQATTKESHRACHKKHSQGRQSI